MGRLDGKVAVVTGAGSGIGRAITRGYAREGARVFAVDRNRESAEATASLASGEQVVVHQADVTSEGEVVHMIAAARSAFGGLDVLVNNAAIQLHGQDGPCADVPLDVWERTIAVNLTGPFLGSKHALPALIERGGGAIINLCSPTGFDQGAGYTAYSSSKGGLSTLTRVIAKDYARHNVRCNAIVPGATATPLTDAIFADASVRGALEAATALGRLGRPDDLVGIAIFLASDEAAYATGAHFFVDGGLTMH